MTRKYKHVMIDIEAMGVNKQSPVVAVGAVFFDPLKNELGPEFYKKVSLESSMAIGTVPDAGTILYWLQGSDAARGEITSAKDSIHSVLILLSSFLAQNSHSERTLRVWANGPTYDVVILEGSYRLCGLEIPWLCYRIQDVRTVVDMGRMVDIDPKKTLPFEGVAHNALDDAKHQARYVSEIISHLIPTKAIYPGELPVIEGGES